MNWLKRKIRIWLQVEYDINALYKNIDTVRKIIKERTDIHCDIGFRDATTIILCGRFRNRDYVQMYNLYDYDLSSIIKHLKEQEQFGNIRRLDTPYGMNVVFEHEFKR